MLRPAILKGATRVVFLVGNYAIKIPRLCSWKHFLQGLLANMQERTFAKTGCLKLCPIPFSLPGGWLVVMRRARPLSDDQYRVLWEELDSWLVDTGKRAMVIPAEKKQDSFGWIDGILVAVDYGS